VQVADNMQQVVNLNEPLQTIQFFDFLVKVLKDSFKDPIKHSRYGFQVQNS
jgi:hypothetical protein